MNKEIRKNTKQKHVNLGKLRMQQDARDTRGMSAMWKIASKPGFLHYGILSRK